jgi:serine/threonine protein kinase
MSGSSGHIDVHPGTVLEGRYLVTRHIGSGGMGSVFLAEDQNVNNKPVAVKFILKDLFKSEDYLLFCQEVQTLARLDSIPGVVKIIDSNLDDRDRPHIVTEFIQGWNLDQFLRDQVPSRLERLQLMVDVCQTLHAVHDEGVLHRDLKPSNILIRQKRIAARWLPVLVDFGLALHRRGDSETGLQSLGGTPHFMSPEHSKGLANLTRRSDVFSLGVILYWLLAEEFPYDLTAGGESAGPDGAQPTIRSLPPEHEDAFGVRVGVPGDLSRIVMKAMSLHPVDRFQTAAELGQQLQAWLDSAQAPAGTPDSASIAIATPSAPQLDAAGADLVRAPHLKFHRLYTESATFIGFPIGHASITRFLGLGSTGLSFHATTDSDEQCRIRLLYPPAGSSDAISAVLDRILARLTALQHPSICRLRRIGRIHFADVQTFYLVSDYIPGQDLLEWTGGRGVEVECGGFTASQLSAAFALAQTLDSAHKSALPPDLATTDLGPFHGHLISTNVIIAPRHRPAVLDFGLAALLPHLALPAPVRDSETIQLAADVQLEPRDRRLQTLCASEAHAMGQLLKSFLFAFHFSGKGRTFPSPDEAFPGCGQSMIHELRQTIRRFAAKGPERCRQEIAPVLARYNQQIRPPLLVDHLVRFLVHDLTGTPLAQRLTDMRMVAVRIAEAAALGVGATDEMIEILSTEPSA